MHKIIKVIAPNGYMIDVTLVTLSKADFAKFVEGAPSPLKEQMLISGIVPMMMRIPINEELFSMYKVSTTYLMIYRDVSGNGSPEAVLDKLASEEVKGEPEEWVVHNGRRMFSLN